PWIGGAIDPEDLLRCRRRGDHAQAAVVVDVRCLHSHARELPHEIGFFIGQRSAADKSEGIVAIGLLNALNLPSNLIQCFFPSHGNKANPLPARHRSFQTIAVLILHISLHALGAEPALVEWEVLPGLEPDHTVVFYLELNAALLA